MIDNDSSEWVKVAEAARVFGVHRRTMLRWVVSGKIKARRVGRTWFIPLSEVKPK